jgi:hypothetical protein
VQFVTASRECALRLMRASTQAVSIVRNGQHVKRIGHAILWLVRAEPRMCLLIER